MKEVVILGGGFAGVAAGLTINKHLSQLDARLTIVDRQSFHLFTPSLYEVATSEQPQKNVAIPLRKIFPKNVDIVMGKVVKIDAAHDRLIFEDGAALNYDYLIVCTGSQTAYFGIPGLEDYSLPLKTLNEAVAIKEKIRQHFLNVSPGEKPVQVYIGGGGFSGTELAAEMISFKNHLMKMYGANKVKMEINVIEGSERLLNVLDLNVSEIARKRLEKDNVKLYLNSFIEKVTEKQLFIKGGKILDYDFLIWTGGVGPNALGKNSGLPTEKHGGLQVNQALQVEGFPNILAAGDNTFLLDTVTQKPAPGVAQVAEEEGKCAAENIISLIKNKPLKNCFLVHYGYVVPLKGKYAAAELKFFHFHGFLGWVLQQFIFLNYLLSILPFNQALTRWNKFEEVFMK